MQFLLFFAVIIAIFAVIFAVQNTAVVTISFIAWRFQGSLALILLIAFGLGAIVSVLVSLPASMKRGRLLAQYKKKLQDIKRENPDQEEPSEDILDG
ncbi:MAG: LapA family protein [Endomicrobiales bacterium]|nr:LapA family protein [Endomicrobiales bacterium]